MKVVIDGVEYVPVIEAQADMKKIARGLVSDFWGVIELDEVEEKMEGLSVRVYDDGKGTPIEDILVLIAESLSKD